ncbi:unnamed protein product [Calicophoron daubneyi]|uniref:RRP15-like protein n=1 Tax=Calicophoron daubneyi TaxID=300641 RepID=A0AAV2TRD1_CALDB
MSPVMLAAKVLDFNMDSTTLGFSPEQMTYQTLIDVINKLLNESIPPGTHPILALAKTDKQRQQARERKLAESDENEIPLKKISNIQRRRWLKEAYKKPLSAAGVRNLHSCLNIVKPGHNGSDLERQLEYAREKRLRSQATRGTIALFNSVRQHQSTIASQLEDKNLLETQKERILTQMTTSDFLDRLSAGLPHAKRRQSDPSQSKSQSHVGADENQSSTIGQKRTARTTFGSKIKKNPSK